MKAPTMSPLGTVSAMAGTSVAVADRGAPAASIVGLKNGNSRSLGDVKPRIIDESMEKSKIWKLAEIKEPSQCCSLRLPNSLLAVKLCAWGTHGWEKQASKFLQIPSGRVPDSLAETRVQFHHDQIHFLVVHKSHLAIYEAAKLECLKQWAPQDGSITHVTYTCDSQMIYTSFRDGSVGVFTHALRLRWRISPSAYLNSQPSSGVYLIVVAAHPSKPNQFALGLTEGSIQVQVKWGTPPLHRKVESE